MSNPTHDEPHDDSHDDGGLSDADATFVPRRAQPPQDDDPDQTIASPGPLRDDEPTTVRRPSPDDELSGDDERAVADALFDDDATLVGHSTNEPSSDAASASDSFEDAPETFIGSPAPRKARIADIAPTSIPAKPTASPPPPRPQPARTAPPAPAAPTRSRRPGGVLAFATLTAIGLAALTGVGLEFHYTPSPELAHASLLSVEQDLTYGSLLRSLHWVAANASIALLLATLVGAFVVGDYRGRSYAWWTGLLTFLVAVGFGITGELLPWTEQGVQATEVRAGIAGMSPGIGDEVRTRLLGGAEVAGPTLTRFHALHVAALPLLLGLVLFLHARARRRIHDGPTPLVTIPQAFAGLLVAVGIGYGATQLAAPLGSSYVAGDSGFEPWPEWHFLWLNKLLHDLPEYDSIVAIYLPGALLGAAFALPFLDRATHRKFAHPAALIPGILVLIGIGTLSGLQYGEKPSNAPTLPYELDYTPLEREGYALVRRHDCLECHQVEIGGETYGEAEPDYEGPPFGELDPSTPLADYAQMLADPEGDPFYLEDMPAYDHVPEEQRRAIGAYLNRVSRGD